MALHGLVPDRDDSGMNKWQTHKCTYRKAGDRWGHVTMMKQHLPCDKWEPGPIYYAQHSRGVASLRERCLRGAVSCCEDLKGFGSCPLCFLDTLSTSGHMDQRKAVHIPMGWGIRVLANNVHSLRTSLPVYLLFLCSLHSTLHQKVQSSGFRSCTSFLSHPKHARNMMMHLASAPFDSTNEFLMVWYSFISLISK